MYSCETHIMMTKIPVSTNIPATSMTQTTTPTPIATEPSKVAAAAVGARLVGRTTSIEVIILVD